MFWERLGTPRLSNLDELHQRIAPRTVPFEDRQAKQQNDQLRLGSPDAPSLNLNNLSDWHGVVAAEVQDPLEHQIPAYTGCSIRGGVSCFQSKAQDRAGVKGSVMVRVLGQNEMMGRGKVRVQIG